jgi:hypothetical protein
VTIEAILSRARDAYLANFVAEIDELRRGGEQFAVELLVQPNGWTSPFPFNLMRIDFMIGHADDPRIVRLVDGPATAAEPFEHVLEGGLRVSGTSVGWEAFDVSFSSETFAVAALDGWLRLWLDVDEVLGVDKHGLARVVHGLAWEADADRWRITADLGSAPVEAALELLGVLAANGVTACELSPPDTADGDA